MYLSIILDKITDAKVQIRKYLSRRDFLWFCFVQSSPLNTRITKQPWGKEIEYSV